MRKFYLTTFICFTFFVLSLNAQTVLPTPQSNSDSEKIKNDAQDRKKQEEYQKKTEEINAKNKIIAENNSKIQRLLIEGNEASKAKNYQLALKKYDEAISIDDYWAALLVLLINKSIVSRQIGADEYNQVIRAKRKSFIVADMYFQQAVDSTEKVINLIKENHAVNELDLKKEIEKYLYISA
ncbi:MAG: hypothetical protein MUC29_11910, partial [Pyrinomonadaceae bacterium]|nr:hypothetical protein [Pyrinomonadaceae bacterium]